MAKLSELLSTIRSTALKKNPGRSLFQLGLPNILQGGEGGTVWVSEASCPRTQNNDNPISL